jgi:hypothetical protein
LRDQREQRVELGLQCLVARLSVAVGVKLFGELVIGRLDLCGRSVATNAEDVIEIGLRKEVQFAVHFFAQAVGGLVRLRLCLRGHSAVVADQLQQAGGHQRHHGAVRVRVRQPAQHADIAHRRRPFDARQDVALNRHQDARIDRLTVGARAHQHGVGRRDGLGQLLIPRHPPRPFQQDVGGAHIERVIVRGAYALVELVIALCPLEQ